MSRIQTLDMQTANRIAAGEVVERPASVVKELVENALDAKATIIHIEIQQGGIRLIRVTDNGTGMDPEDAVLAFERHATSKLKQIEDLERLLTLGFRGEALPSIAAVSRTTVETREKGTSIGTRLILEAGSMIEKGETGCAEGTSITVESLFFNVPARYKFLKKDTTETGHITEWVERIALARPDVSFRLTCNQQEVLHTPGNNDLSSALYAVFGKKTAQACLSVNGEENPVRVNGLVGRPEIARGNRKQQCFYVNGRLIRSRTLTAALDEAFKTRLMKGRYAVAFLFLSVPQALIDVNVHPQKMAVRFWNDAAVFRCVYHAVKDVLQAEDGITAEPEPEKTKHTDPKNDETIVREPDQASMKQSRLFSYDQPGMDSQPVSLNDEPENERKTGKTGEGFSYVDEGEGSARAPVDKLSHAGQTLTVRELSESRYIGCVFQTYLLFEYDDNLIMVDQHAAHEKILFERLIERHQKASQQQAVPTQNLLVPIVIDMDRQEIQYIQDQLEKLDELGFACSLIGPTSIAIRTVPDTGRWQMNPEIAFRLAVESISSEDGKHPDGRKSLYSQMACKAAVKAHDRLDPESVKSLVQDLMTLKEPYRCPHGRPVMIRMTRHELEKRFKRTGP
jgi:DNA mismatch repair protein MutL